tara:strand:+ start:1122 stop:1244 length:123 start_codon:yes stop_codon:yes gene_type:complete
MIKNLVLLIILSIVIISCGKKNCPKNKEIGKCHELFEISK